MIHSYTSLGRVLKIASESWTSVLFGHLCLLCRSRSQEVWVKCGSCHPESTESLTADAYLIVGLGCTMRATADRSGVDLVDSRLLGTIGACDLGGSDLYVY
jgi:hypothetical protein